MILDVIISLAAAVLGLVTWVFSLGSSLVNSLLPDFTTQITWVFGFLNYFRGILDVQTLMSCTLFLIVVWVFKYQIRLFFKYVFPMIPYFGSRHIEPFSEHQVNLSGRSNTVNLRQRGSKGRILYTTRDIR